MAVDFPDWTPAIRPGLFDLQGNGVVILAGTGVREAIVSPAVAAYVIIKARAANLGTIYMGDDTVTNDEDPGTGGFQMAPGDTVTMSGVELADVYLIGTAGDGISYMYFV